MVNYDPSTDEALSDLFSDRRQLQKRNINLTLDLIILADVLLDIGLLPSVVVEKQSPINFIWNESSQDDKTVWNPQPTAWTEIVSSTDIVPLTLWENFLKKLVK